MRRTRIVHVEVLARLTSIHFRNARCGLLEVGASADRVASSDATGYFRVAVGAEVLASAHRHTSQFPHLSVMANSNLTAVFHARVMVAVSTR